MYSPKTRGAWPGPRQKLGGHGSPVPGLATPLVLRHDIKHTYMYRWFMSCKDDSLIVRLWCCAARMRERSYFGKKYFLAQLWSTSRPSSSAGLLQVKQDRGQSRSGALFYLHVVCTALSIFHRHVCYCSSAFVTVPNSSELFFFSNFNTILH